MTSPAEVSPKVAPAPAVSSKAAVILGIGIAACGVASVATLALAASIQKEVNDLGEGHGAVPIAREAGGIFGVELLPQGQAHRCRVRQRRVRGCLRGAGWR